MLTTDEKMLFIGDSVTDCGRDRKDANSLGGGYVSLIASRLSTMFPERQLQFLNKGISGNRVKDLAARWSEDCIEEKPSLISILIGINDTWRRYDSNDPTTTKEYEEMYRGMLQRVKKETQARLVLLEPFLVETNLDQLVWREDLDPKIQVARRLAYEFGALLIPTDGLFAQAVSRHDAKFWAQDGVHPSTAGHALIAEAWIEAVLKLVQ